MLPRTSSHSGHGRRSAPRGWSTFRFTVGNAGYLAGTLVAFIWPVAALIIFGLLAVYYMFEHLPESAAGDDQREQAGADRVTEQS